MIEQLVSAIQEGRSEPVVLWLKLKRFIYAVLKHYEGQEYHEDLIQESYFALLSAIRLYAPDKGTPFISYYRTWVRTYAGRYIDNNCRLIRLPAGQAVKVSQYNRLVSRFVRDLGREPSDQEIEEALGVTAEEIRREAQLLKVGSLDSPAGEDTDISIGECVPDAVTDVESEALDRIEQEELSEKLWALVDDLPEAEAKTIRMRYQEGQTQKQCGEALGVTASRVGAIEETAIRRMRRNSEIEKQLQPYLDDYRYAKGIHTGRHRICGEDYYATEYAVIKAMTYMEKYLKQKGLISP